MRKTYRYDADLDCLVRVGDGSNHVDAQPSGMQIIKDIEPYRTAASDVASDGKRVVIGSRSRHRTFLRDNSYTEVGNEALGQEKRPTLSREELVHDIRRALGDFGSNTGMYRRG